MPSRVIRSMLFSVCCFCLAAGVNAQDRWNFPEKATNLQVLPKETPGSELRPVMFGFTRALGKRCSNCHKGEEGQPLSTYDFASDERPDKARAREMLRMLDDIKAHLKKITPSGGEAVEVTCYTCHRGRPRPLSLHAELMERYRAAGADSTVAYYRELKARYYGHSAFDFNEFGLAGVGREVLDKNDVNGALALFTLATTEFPESGFAWSGLAEATLRSGDGTRAAAYYEKSLKLNPRNPSAKRMLDSLQNVRK